jgi:predicted transcriptional regulator
MSSVLAMATEVILALLRAGQLSPAAVVPVLQETHAYLLALQARETGRRTRPSPRGAAVPAGLPWQASLTPERITCLECGASLQWLSGRHLQKHGLDAQAYRRKYGIPRTQPLAIPAVTARRQRLIRQQRPWEKAPSYLHAQARQAATAVQRVPPRRPRKRSPAAR